ncbi:energy transducer TonB [Flavobacterium sp. H122]|uniref:energy transducer TonB n=1 Tax=Flavobacterium sp. H122 TaxID=2529860 RepID=UPI0010AA5D22|nr:energy transducer TonB [Flavobacterium sp. H122]
MTKQLYILISFLSFSLGLAQNEDNQAKVTFDLPSNNSNTFKLSENEIYNSISLEKVAEYPGGVKKFYKDFNSKFRFQQEVDIVGRVIFEFVVEPDGTLTDIKIIKGLGFGIEKEALEILKSLGNWNPGINYGKPVRSRMLYPIRLDLRMETDYNLYFPK